MDRSSNKCVGNETGNMSGAPSEVGERTRRCRKTFCLGLCMARGHGRPQHVNDIAILVQIQRAEEKRHWRALFFSSHSSEEGLSHLRAH